jgi:para-aminobenzoate synthetase component 1
MGGFAGFVSYDYCVKQRFNLPPPPKAINHIPQFYGGIYDVVFYANHQTHQAGIIALNIHPHKTASERIKIMLEMAQRPCTVSDMPFNIQFPSINPDIYKDAVNKTINYIKNGDIFQANIARAVILDKPAVFNSFALYHSLRTINPSPFGCYIHDNDFQIISASPERFLKIDNRIITVEPIKGTIKSNPDAVLDKHQQETLLNCPKNRAENMIIVDLLRNDITPFAKTGTINADILCELQTFRGLHHLVSRVTAQMQDTAHIIDVLKMALPGGSITGAPKKRVSEIIYELEAAQRGAYCGSAGYIGFDGNVDMNILIRTIQTDNQSIIFHSGCGITAQSDATQEWQETKTKADKILQSFLIHKIY